ncbi:hypothetical protein BCR44DRAFT_34252 [Catenaria anguillulae PL171]|uniref:Protein kinase domain-containing protein n=1 Tax=Catenaria anguillulae PL171 TaxID=765915 RepID=A0A1Y2HL41_9FUNG|nr:hypothetical protein BCR44DRAFT_34252 [Catenaria anguillulae PL171]
MTTTTTATGSSSLRESWTLVSPAPRSLRSFLVASAANANGNETASTNGILKCGTGASDSDSAADVIARELGLIKRLHLMTKQHSTPVALPILAHGIDPLFGHSRRPWFITPQAPATLADVSPGFVATYARDLATSLLYVLQLVHTHHAMIHRDLRPATIALQGGTDGVPPSLVLLGWDAAVALPSAPASDAPIHFIDLASIPPAAKLATRGRLDRTAFWSLRAHRTGGPTCPADDVEAGLLALAAAMQPSGWLPWALDPSTGAPYTESPADAGSDADWSAARSPFLTALEGRKWQAPVSHLPHVPKWLGEALTRVRALAVGEMPPYSALRGVCAKGARRMRPTSTMSIASVRSQM